MNHLHILDLASFLFLGLGLFCGTSGALGPRSCGPGRIVMCLWDVSVNLTA